MIGVDDPADESISKPTQDWRSQLCGRGVNIAESFFALAWLAESILWDVITLNFEKAKVQIIDSAHDAPRQESTQTMLGEPPVRILWGGKGRVFHRAMYAHRALAPLTLLTPTDSLDRKQLSCSCDLRQPHKLRQTCGALKRPGKGAIPAL